MQPDFSITESAKATVDAYTVIDTFMMPQKHICMIISQVKHQLLFRGMEILLMRALTMLKLMLQQVLHLRLVVTK
jgi:hypothetical protein